MSNEETMSSDERYAIVDVLRYLVVDFYQQAEYIKSKDANESGFNEEFEAGILHAYSRVLDTIYTYANVNEIDKSNIGFDVIKPFDVIEFKPKNWPENKPLL